MSSNYQGKCWSFGINDQGTWCKHTESNSLFLWVRFYFRNFLFFWNSTIHTTILYWCKSNIIHFPPYAKGLSKIILINFQTQAIKTFFVVIYLDVMKSLKKPRLLLHKTFPLSPFANCTGDKKFAFIKKVKLIFHIPKLTLDLGAEYFVAKPP